MDTTCIHGKNKCKPTYDAMVVHRNSYFKECLAKKERICLNCKHWNIQIVVIGKCENKSMFNDFNGMTTWYSHSCKLCHLKEV